MIRRNFIQRLTLGGAVGLANAAAGANRRVTFKIKGFSCIACAVGLDSLLSQHTGVVHCKSSYPDATATIEFNPDLVTEESLKAAIAEMGFTAQRNA